jgi:hypothetical protein
MPASFTEEKPMAATRMLRAPFIAAIALASLSGAAEAQPWPPPGPDGRAAAMAQARPPRVVRDEIEGRLSWINEVGQRLDQAARTPGALAGMRLDEVGRQLQQQVALVRQLQGELAMSIRREAQEHREREGWAGGNGGPDDAYAYRRVAPPPPGPMAMSPADFAELRQRVQDEPFENNRLSLLRDAIQAGARFTSAQALAIVEELDFAQGKMQAAAMMCPAMAEPGALPRLIAAMPYETYRDQLRRATGGRCGP